MTANPYAPPTTDSTQGGTPPAPPAKSFARRASFTLAAVAFVMFWAAAAFAASQSDHSPSKERSDIVAGVGVLLAMALHLVGIGVVFAAPRGRRFVPALLNGLSLALMVALLIYGLSKGTTG